MTTIGWERGFTFGSTGPDRALDWAEEQKERGRIEQPAVVGAIIHLGRCFDLLDTRSTSYLSENFPVFEEVLKRAGQKLPANSPDPDSLLRRRDCAMVNFALSALAEQHSYQTVRGVFQEGEFAYEGSSIRRKSHIQIAVRARSCILGYFIPEFSL